MVYQIENFTKLAKIYLVKVKEVEDMAIVGDLKFINIYMKKSGWVHLIYFSQFLKVIVLIYSFN